MTRKYQEFTLEIFNTYLIYNPTTGAIKNKMETMKLKAGTILGSTEVTGYTIISYGGYRGKAHRLAILDMTGSYPQEGFDVDHINGVKTDNRWCNLRIATKAQNQHNRGIPINNSSNIKGVWKSFGKFNTRVTFNKKCYSAGRFLTLEEAEIAIKNLRETLHGKFANHGSI